MTKADLKNISHIYFSSNALKSNLASLKTEVDKLDLLQILFQELNMKNMDQILKIKSIT